MSAYIYEIATGRIAWRYDGPDPAGQVPADHDYIEASGDYDDREFYVAAGAIVPRPPCQAVANKTTIAADEIDTVTISGIPDGAIVLVVFSDEADAETLYNDEVTDNEMVITVGLPGLYTVTIESFPAQTGGFAIVAT